MFYTKEVHICIHTSIKVRERSGGRDPGERDPGGGERSGGWRDPGGEMGGGSIVL